MRRLASFALSLSAINSSTSDVPVSRAARQARSLDMTSQPANLQLIILDPHHDMVSDIDATGFTR